MCIRILSRLIGTFTAVAIALTTVSAAPAYAGNDRDKRNARALATILGIAIVGKIIHDNKKDRDKKVVRKSNRSTHSQGHQRVQRHGQRTYGKTNRHVQPRPLPRRVDRKLLPQNCFRSFNTRRGQVHMFGRRCLEQNFRFANNLPRDCAQRVRTDRGVRAGFDARCLRRNGYRLARG